MEVMLQSLIVLLSLLVAGTHGQQNMTRANKTSDVYNTTEKMDVDEDGEMLLAHEQQRLAAYLFKNYNPNVRPVSDPSMNLSVIITPSLRQIVQIDEKQQVVKLYFWLRMYWYDNNFTWNKTDYKNISQINVSPGNIWLPDITLINSAQKGQDALVFRKITTDVQVHDDGLCRWLSPYFSSTSCSIDSTNFPFDEQTCIVEMASWTQSGLKIDVNLAVNSSIDTVAYLENIQWKLMSASAVREVKYYTASPEPFPSVIFKFVIRRRSLFYIINLILPCVILSVLSLMTFYIPPSSGERITLSISLLLTMLFTLYIVTENLPPDSTTVPLLTKFIAVAMLIMTLSLFATSVGIKFDEKAKLMPQWMVVIINKYLACLVLHDTSWMQRCLSKNKQTSNEQQKRRSTNSEDQTEPLRANYDNEPEPDTTCRHRKLHTTDHRALTTDQRALAIYNRSNPIMADIANKFRYMSSRIEKKQSNDELGEDWHKAGEVLSKLFFWSFFAVLVFASVAIFSKAEYTE